MRALICGAGIAGLALAQRLDAHGWEVTVVEEAPGPRPQGYMLDFFGLGYDAVARMGALPRVTELGYDVDEVVYVDERGRRRAGISYDGFAQAVDHRLVSIMRPDLEQALREQVTDRVDLRYGVSVAGLTQLPQRVRVRLTDGSEPDVDLLVGADGIHSRVRHEAMGAEGRFLRYLGLHTAAWTFEDPDANAQLGRRWCLTDTVDRMMGLYALRDGRVAVLTVHRSADPARPADVPAALRRNLAGLGWLVPRALELCPPAEEIYYDQVAQVEVPRWSSGRVTLVGDACQAVSLLAGQGASLAAAGSYVLGERLAASASVEEALAGYEAAWRPVVEATQRTGRSGIEWFLPSSPARRRLRRLTFAAAALPGLNGLLRRTLVGKTRVSLDELRADRLPTTAPG